MERTLGDCEVRTYEAYAVAELTEERPDGDAFNILAAYLFGKNSEEKAMAMTMPVEMVDGVMSFVLPKADADAPPAPTDDKVTIGAAGAHRRGAAVPGRGDAGRDRAPALEAGGRLEGGGPGSRGRLVRCSSTTRRSRSPGGAAMNWSSRWPTPKPLVRRKARGDRGPAPPAMPPRGLERVPVPGETRAGRRGAAGRATRRGRTWSRA